MRIVNNKLAHIIYQTIYVVLGFVGILGSFGYFSAKFNSDFYVYYTNLSNYLCFGMMLTALIISIKNFNKDNKPVSIAPAFKFMCMIMITVTCLVYNILLAKENSVSDYFLSLSNLTNHLILPIMFILDWVLFYEHGKTKWYYPLLSLIMPLVYVLFIMIRASILQGAKNTILYPYFFLNIPNLGIGLFFAWLIGLITIFVILGYLIYALDNINNWKNKKSSI